MTIQDAVSLFDNGKYKQAFENFATIYNESENPQERQDIMSILQEAYYAPNVAELQANYEKNIAALSSYPYFWDKQFVSFSDLSFLLFPTSDESYHLYDKQTDRFIGAYDGVTRHQMRYFFQDVEHALRIEDEDNLYNLTFLFDNVRRSEDVAMDNHIYLLYNSWQPLQRVLQVGDITPLLEHEKFVFLIEKKNHSRYPIDYKNDFGVDYHAMKSQRLRIEEINRIYLNQFYGYSGTDFFEGVVNGSDHILVVNGWFFYESSEDIVKKYTEMLQTPEKEINVQMFFKVANARVDEVKFTGWPQMLSILLQILGERRTVAVHQLWKAIMISAMYLSQAFEKKQYESRITPIVFFDPHGAPCSDYYELMKYFKYPAVEATFREPITRLMRQISVFGIGSTLEELKSNVCSTYIHSKNIPHWLTEKGFYVAKLEDLKLKPEQTLHTICRIFNIPYTEKLLSGKIGIWGVLFTNEKGEQLQGFDQRSVKRDISHMVTPDDKKRLDLFYWPIHHYFGYPCEPYQIRMRKEDAENLFSVPFLFERQYEEQRREHLEARNYISADKQEALEKVIQKKYVLDPHDIRAMLKEVMVNLYMNGFDDDLALPDVMLPEESGFIDVPQAARLRKQKLKYVSKVYWLTGLSGAGKTTIGKLLYHKLQKRKKPVVFLDGDMLRQVFGDDLGYSPEDRLKSATRNARLCKMLSEQGLDVVCCTISMFDSIRQWNRENMPGYIEIYVKASMETLKRRDQKGLYTNSDDSVAGVNFAIEEPKNPDIILENDGKFTPEEQLNNIMQNYI